MNSSGFSQLETSAAPRLRLGDILTLVGRQRSWLKRSSAPFVLVAVPTSLHQLQTCLTLAHPSPGEGAKAETQTSRRVSAAINANRCSGGALITALITLLHKSEVFFNSGFQTYKELPGSAD